MLLSFYIQSGGVFAKSRKFKVVLTQTQNVHIEGKVRRAHLGARLSNSTRCEGNSADPLPALTYAHVCIQLCIAVLSPETPPSLPPSLSDSLPPSLQPPSTRALTHSRHTSLKGTLEEGQRVRVEPAQRSASVSRSTEHHVSTL